ncbi:hypothetical protein ABW19_dt0208466 [Dactylella cylindrospora]|nr:hypothetical protein ABW19_dt0208466 [Dactylella cylindrospora]
MNQASEREKPFTHPKSTILDAPVEPQSSTPPPMPERRSGGKQMIESSGIGDTARKIEGAADYFRHTFLAQVDHAAGDRASAEEKERLAKRAADQMATGKKQPLVSPLNNPTTSETAPEPVVISASSNYAAAPAGGVVIPPPGVNIPPPVEGEVNVNRGNFKQA